ncbi:MAG: hypothetical protein JSU63_11105 [Phycisphaerales bacterium]|nr:MAG: hypothetical protein JSU63_11105 [Phycisphaerales bacterium]
MRRMRLQHVAATVLFPTIVLPGRVWTQSSSAVGNGGVSPAASRSTCPDATVTIEIMTDWYPQETIWMLKQEGVGTIASGGPLSDPLTLHTWDVCVESTECYNFTIYDTYTDGLLHPGYYRVYYEGEIVGSGREFASAETVADLSGGCEPAYCGDGTCDPDETHLSCPEDCPPCEYCDACYTDPTSDWITRVVFNTIDNTTEQDGSCSYGDYSSLFTTVTRQSSYTLRVSFFSDGQWVEHVRVWIDWNQDCAFESSESYYLGEGIDATLSRSITVPADALRGCTRMRVVENFHVDPNQPCPNLFYGEVEDYTVCATDALLGACCVNEEPWCRGFLTEAECDADGGTFLGVGSICDLPDCNDNGVSDQCDSVGSGDFDANGYADLEDYIELTDCLDGPGVSPSVPLPACLTTYLAAFDSDFDGDVDLKDVGVFCRSFAGTSK